MKPRHRSKTLWFNALAAAAALLAAPEIAHLIGTTAAASFLPVAIAVVNIGLRLVTSEPLAGTKAARAKVREV